MKKLITGAIAAMALLLGFASCSGDLHENDVQPLYVVGAGFEGATWELENLDVKAAQATLVESDGSVQKFELKATASTAQVKFATARSWSNDIAGSDLKELFPVVNGDAVSLFSREANALPNTNNVVINDLTVGETYIIDINFNPISLATSIKVSGNAVIAPDMQIIMSTDASGKGAVKIPMTRAGATYTYEFIAAKTTDVYYYFYCPALNTTYYVVEDTDKDIFKFEQVKAILYDAHGNTLNADGNVVTDDSYAPDGWKAANKESIVNDHKYSIEIVANDTYKGFNGDIIYKVTVDDIDKDGKGGILKNAVLIGQWNYTDNHDGDYAIDLTKEEEKEDDKIIWTGWSGKFTAKGTSVKFKVLRDKSEDTMAWGGNVKITAKDDYNKRGETEQLKYETTLVSDEKNGFAYTVPKEKKSALKEVDYITAEVVENERYKISIVDNDDFGKFTICLTKLEPFGLLSDELAKCGIRGTMNGWDITEKDEAESKKGHFVFGPFEGDHEFKLATMDWKDFEHQYTYDGESITVENKKDATETVILKQSKDGDPNIAVNGISGKYNIIIDVDDATKEVKCTIKVTEAGEKDDSSNIEKFTKDVYINGSISFGNEVYAASSTYATDKKSATIKYGPFRKSDIGVWILTDGSVNYRSRKLRYVDSKGNKGTEVTLAADTGVGKDNEITDVTFDESFYYIVVRVTTNEDGNIDKVYAKIEPTNDSKIPYSLTNPMLDNAGIIGTINGWNAAKMTKINDNTYSYDFTATDSTGQFSVQEKFGSWDSRWCGGAKEGDTSLSFSTPTEVGKPTVAQNLVYVKGGNPPHVQLLDLSKASVYTITITINDFYTKKISAKIELKQAVEDEAGPLDDILLKGDLDSWGDGIPLVSNGDKTSYSVEFTPKTETIAFKLANAGWSVAYPCAEDSSAQTIAADGKEVKFYKGDTYPNNPSLTGLTSGKNYIMTIVPSEDGTFVTVSVSEK